MPAASISSAGVPEPGMSRTASLTTVGGRRPGCDEGVEHGVAEPALEPVVLDHDQLAAGVPRGLLQRLPVDRLDRIGVDDADRDAFGLQRLVRLQRLVHA